MTTLTTPPLAPLLAQLFAEAETTDAALREEMSKLSPEERTALFSDTDYRAVYGRVKDRYLAVSRETGVLCYMLARACRARSIVEFGTSFGISTLHLAAALKDNGGGRVIGTEFEPSKVARAREHIAAAGLTDFVEIRAGDAVETLAHDLPELIDLVLLDGAKGLYCRVLSLLAPRLHAGALVVADNADMCPEYVAHVRAPAGGYLSVPVAGGVELSMKMK
ncbi:MAG: class I SAM-dependent methyltransferase [Candidatus Binatia bacterium]